MNTSTYVEHYQCVYEGSTSYACTVEEVCTHAVRCELGLGLIERVTFFMVMTPDDPVVPQVTNALREKAKRRYETECARNPMAVCQESNGHQSARTAGGPYTNERIKRKKQVATTEQEVYVVKERVFLHKTVVQRAEP